MRIIQDIKPSLSGGKSQGIVSNQGITYNEVGVSYNDARYSYGGVYNYPDFSPSLSLATSLIPKIQFAFPSQAYVQSSTITYNEPTVTYNDPLYAYGGLYGYPDVIPIVSLAFLHAPRIIGFGDIYTPGGTTPPTPGNNIPLGPGFFMFITYP